MSTNGVTTESVSTPAIIASDLMMTTLGMVHQLAPATRHPPATASTLSRKTHDSGSSPATVCLDLQLVSRLEKEKLKK